MKYCLSVGLHNWFFDLAIVGDNHKIIKKYKCSYNRNKDIASNIYTQYKKYFSNYSVSGVGIGISNNILFKDEFIYKIKSFNFNRYNLKQSLYKLFEVDIYLMEETYLSSLAISYSLDVKSLLYVILDNKISNSFVIDKEIIDLDDDLNLAINEELNYKCSKDALKADLLMNDLDDDYIGKYFLSQDKTSRILIENWASNLDKYLKKIVKELPIKKIVFGGYLGEYFEYFNEYLTLNKSVSCQGVINHREQTLIGVSHLIFKDN